MGEGYITVADTKYPRILSCNIVKEKVKGEDSRFSCEGGLMLQQENTDYRIVLKGNEEKEFNKRVPKIVQEFKKEHMH